MLSLQASESGKHTLQRLKASSEVFSPLCSFKIVHEAGIDLQNHLCPQLLILMSIEKIYAGLEQPQPPPSYCSANSHRTCSTVLFIAKFIYLTEPTNTLLPPEGFPQPTRQKTLDFPSCLWERNHIDYCRSTSLLLSFPLKMTIACHCLELL